MKRLDLYICVTLINIHIIIVGALLSRSYMVYENGTLFDQLSGNPILKLLLVLDIIVLVINVLYSAKSNK